MADLSYIDRVDHCRTSNKNDDHKKKTSKLFVLTMPIAITIKTMVMRFANLISFFFL